MTCMESFHWKPPEQGVAEWGRWLGLCCPPVVGVGGVRSNSATGEVDPGGRLADPRPTSQIHSNQQLWLNSCRWNLQCWTWEATKKTIRRLTKGDFGPQLLWRISPTHHPQCSGQQRVPYVIIQIESQIFTLAFVRKNNKQTTAKEV